MTGASDKSDRAVVNGAASVSALRASVPSAEPCQHETQIKSCGMKVCFDCGAPLNTKAKQIAAMRGAA